MSNTPSNAEAWDLWLESITGGHHPASLAKFARAVLAKWGTQPQAEAAPGVGNSGFDHKTAADLLNNKTVSDEAVRKFVATSRWAHDERAALSATLLAMRGVLASREAEIAHLKKALLEAQLEASGFTAADMATAEARGFRDGAASAMAGEPMAWMTFTEEGDPDMVFLDRLEACQYCEDDDPPKPLYLAAPPTAQAEGWRPISTAPRDGTEVLADTSGLGRVVVYWDDEKSQWGTGFGYLDRGEPTHWMPLPPLPTSAEGVEHG